MRLRKVAYNPLDATMLAILIELFASSRIVPDVLNVVWVIEFMPHQYEIEISAAAPHIFREFRDL